MDCLEFRRLLGIDPHALDRAAREHMAGCPACAEAQGRAEAFEARLQGVLSVPVPAGLAERILEAQRREPAPRRPGAWRRGWIALAAAAVVALAVGALLRREHAPDSVMGDLVVEHVNGPERQALQLSAPVPAAAVRRAFADRGVTLHAVPTGVSYVHECPVGKYRSVHMVMPEGGRPVSVLYIVDYRAAAIRDFRHDAMNGREVPIAKGTLVLAAPQADRFDAIEQAWRGAIEGPPQVAAAGP